MNVEDFILKFNHKCERYIVDVNYFHPAGLPFPLYRANVLNKIFIFYENDEQELSWYALPNYNKQCLATAIAKQITWHRYNK